LWGGWGTFAFVTWAPIRFISGILLMVALGLTQLHGVSHGYWCECAPEPKRVDGPDCVVAGCHSPSEASDEEVRGCQDAGHRDDHSECPCGPDHQHREVRESLRTTAVATAVPVPAPMEYDLPPSLIFSAGVSVAGVPPCGGAVRWHRAGDRRPPPPLRVARTMVMLV